MKKPDDVSIHEAVEAVRKRDRRQRRGLVGLGLFITLLLLAHTWIGFGQRGTLEKQVAILEQQGAELKRVAMVSAQVARDTRRETRVSQRLVRELRARFKNQAEVSRRLQQRTARFLQKLARRAGVPVEDLSIPARIVTRSGGGGGGPGKAPKPQPPGEGNPKACENPGKACER